MINKGWYLRGPQSGGSPPPSPGLSPAPLPSWVALGQRLQPPWALIACARNGGAKKTCLKGPGAGPD